jgi:cytoskeletal protein RodZ
MEDTNPITLESRAAFSQFLVCARQRAGLSLEEVARQTKIAPRYLERLEAGQVEALPAGVYRRAIVRAYASSVHLEQAAAIEWLERTFGDAAARPFRLEPPPEPPKAEPVRMPAIAQPRALVAAASILLVVLAFGAHVMWSRAAEPSGHAGTTGVLQPEEAAAGDQAASSAAPPATVADIVAPPEPVVSAARAVVSPRLVVTSLPSGARVTVNGIGWGVTPITIRNLPPGEKVIRVTKDGYIGREQRVQIDEGEAAVRVTLRPRS